MNTSNIINPPLRPPFKGMTTLIHTAAWLLVLSLPFFFTGRETHELTLINYLRAEVPPVSFMLIFYANYMVLIDEFLNARRGWMFFLSNILLIAFVMVAVHLLMQLFPHPVEIHHGPRPNNIGFFMVNALMYMLVAALSVAIRMTSGWYQAEKERRELENSRTEAELKNLKSQLNPHFLFNTLNNIYSLIAFDPDRAQAAVHDMSVLLRYVLYESSQNFVTLQKEEDFVKNYVELMRIRLSEQVEVKTEITAEQPDVLIAPLLFISLIENAFKHGISPSSPSFVHISITEKQSRVVCQISNSFFPKDAARDKSGSGIGIQNLKRRLDLLYPGRFIFTYGQQGDTYYSLLEIQLS